jgi:NADH-quinone oxidoreductase subunit J
MGNSFVFMLLAVIAVGSAIGMLVSRDAVHSALFLVLNFITIAVFYLVLNAPFIAMVQVTVYAGAIMVLFMFVIMLLGAERLRGMWADRPGELVFAAFLAFLLVATFLIALVMEGKTAVSTASMIDTSPVALGLRLFEAYVFPFEVTGVLLLTAMVGVVILTISNKRGKNV